MQLRPYQETAIQSLREALRAKKNPLLTAPCGSGKGTIITYIVQRAVERGHKIIFAVHGKSLVEDMSQRVTRLGISHGVLMGGKPRERWHPVQVASIDTLHRMEHPPEASIIIVDECHMSASPTWGKALGYYIGSRVIGMTATPIRLDRKGLGRTSGGFFDVLVLGPSEVDLIRDGYLVGSRVLAPPPPEDLGAVKKTAGEFNPKQQAQVCDKTQIIGDIVKHWERHAAGRKTAAFGIDQAHANHITEQFRAAGHSWAYVDAETPMDERGRIWRDLDEGSLMGVASVGCISIGWDHPVVSCLIAARKTASLGLWRQMLGRGSRISPGKSHFLVLDHVGNSLFHAPYGMFEDAVPWQLDGEAAPTGEREKEDRYVQCKTPAAVDGVLRYPCYAYFKAGPKECPECGIPLVKKIAKVQQIDGELRELRRGDLEQAVRQGGGNQGLRAKMAALYALLKVAKNKGYKPQWAAKVYQTRYGTPPPPEWMETQHQGPAGVQESLWEGTCSRCHAPMKEHDFGHCPGVRREA